MKRSLNLPKNKVKRKKKRIKKKNKYLNQAKRRPKTPKWKNNSKNQNHSKNKRMIMRRHQSHMFQKPRSNFWETKNNSRTRRNTWSIWRRNKISKKKERLKILKSTKSTLRLRQESSSLQLNKQKKKELRVKKLSNWLKRQDRIYKSSKKIHQKKLKNLRSSMRSRPLKISKHQHHRKLKN